MEILFLGGCLFTTKTVEKDQRFINVLLSRNPGWKATLARYSSYSLVGEILAGQMNKATPDAVVFLARPFPFYTLAKLFPRVPSLRSGITIKVHPRLLGRRDWFIDNDRLIVELDWNPNGTKRTVTHAINLTLGKFFKLDGWAIEYVKRQLSGLNDQCRKKNIPLLIAGSPEVLNDKLEHKLLTRFNREMQGYLEKTKIPFLNLFSDDFPPGMLGPDKVHYNAEGHRRLAVQLEKMLVKRLVVKETT